MFNFSIQYFLIPYGLFVLIFLVFSFFNIYHLMRYGIYNFALYVLSVIYLSGTIFVLGMSAIILFGFDWSVSLELGQILDANRSEFITPGL